MTKLRADVAERLARPAIWNPGGTTSPSKEDPMALSDADVKKVAAAVVEQLLTADRFTAPTDAADYSDDPKNPRHYWTGRSVFADLVTRVRRIDKALTALTKEK
ncbi:hypothetical protein OHU11_09665 [Streptomyces sp. NBC_00257]|uniref:hypothetical protein n=1 Tax=unclassified Streptomyces TaxID=2593676 RepID=UPI0022554881|nr:MULTISPECIES: hypothetical protein [unclassified Streptomyces]MCX5427940.1 hypothetical protein [Streptomyces sp. NBC_00062]